MRAAVDAFRARGGCVVGPHPEWAWHEPGAFGRVSREFLGAVGHASAPAPVEARGGPERMHMVAFSGGDRMTVALVNDFTWVHTGGKPKAPAAKAAPPRPSAEGENEPVIGGASGTMPGPCRGVRVTFRLPARPARVSDRVTGRELAVSGADGVWSVDVPDFDCLAVLEVAAR